MTMPIPLDQRRRLQVPECVRHLDLDLAEQVLTRHEGHTHRAAIELGVPPSAFRKLTWAVPRLLDVAFTENERLLDDAEAVVRRAVRGEHEQRALSASLAVLLHHRGGRARGFVPATSSVEDGVSDAEPVQIQIRWGHPPLPTETVIRDGVEVQLPVYEQRDLSVAAEDRHDDVGDDRQVNDQHDDRQVNDSVAPSLNEARVDPDPVSEAPPEPSALPVWPGPGGPPPLVANKYQPRSPPGAVRRVRAAEAEELPPLVRRPSRGGWR